MLPTRRSTLATALLATAALLASPATAQNRRQDVRIPRLFARYVPPPGTAAPDSSGLRFRLESGAAADVTARPAVAMGRLLTAAEAQRLLARLAPLAAPATPADSFFFPAQTLPPPRAGLTVAEPFPPRDTAAAGHPVRPGAQPAAALSVIRRAPEGEVDTGAEVTLTFSQPMVPLGSVGEVAAQAAPARLSPQPPGRWRWIDARTLKFEPRGRLPMATVYTVEIPAGTRSATGIALPEPVRWSFSTPAARAIGSLPQGETTGLTPVMAVAFDQRIDPAAVLRSISVTAYGAAQPVRLATAQEIADDSALKAVLDSQEPGRWLAFRSVRPLPRDAQIVVSVGPGTPSAEGPRVTEVRQFWEFRTYGALRVGDSDCGCRPGNPFIVRFSNPLDERSFRPGMVTVEPAVHGMDAWVSGNMLVINGETQPNTRYTVRLDPALRDRFGQTLGSTRPLTFDVGAPYASIEGPPGILVVPDPLAEPAISIRAQGHRRLRLRIQRVQPEDWAAYRDGARRGGDRSAPLPGTTVVDRTITVDSPLGEEREVRVDVTPALSGGVGNAVVAVEAVEGSTQWEREQAVYTWVQVTRIGLAAYADGQDLLAWASSLVDGSPVAGAEVRLLVPGGSASSATTDARGTATLPLPPSSSAQPILVVRAGGDVAFLAQGVGGWASWTRAERRPSAAWFTFTDRNLYRPGETVRFKGWVRRIDPGKNGGIGLLRADSVAWTAKDARGNQIARGTARVSELGGFDASFTPPAGSNLGTSLVEVRLLRPEPGLAGETTNVSYELQEFRRPEYTVTAQASEGPHFVGGSAEVTARAAYFAGGALPAAPVHWVVTSSPGFFTPPGWDEWSFGSSPAIWRGVGFNPGGAMRTETLDATTGASGEHVLRISFVSADPPRPYAVRAQATVTDVNRQTWSADASLLVHPAAVYVGMRTQRAWLSAGDSIDLDLIAVDLNGKPVAGRTLEVTAVRRSWRRTTGGAWEEVVGDSARCTRQSEANPVRCVFRAAEPGAYEITAATRDLQGRPAESSMVIWVAGRGGMAVRPDENGERNVELVPDRKTYAVGDTAHILVRTAFTPSRGLLTLRRNGLARTEEVRIDGAMTTLSIPLTEADVPNVWVQLDLVGATDGRHGEGARGVNFAVGMVNLSVPPVTRALAVRALPRDSATAPDAETAVGVEVKDAAGRPVPNAEVALVVVDEAVLALTGYRIADPLDAFYSQRAPGVQDLRLREVVQVVAPDFPPEPHTLVGRVVDARNGGFLGGATVTVEGTSVKTDDAGRFRIPNVAAGSRTVVVTMEGYADARTTVTVTDAAPAPLRIALVPQRVLDVVRNGMAGGIARREAAMAAPLEVPPPPPPPPPAPGAQVRLRGANAQQPQPQIAIRTNFDPLALWSPVVRTDGDGHAVVPFKLPSNLTRYRVTAVAVDGATRYGRGESAITARQPLMVRPSAPRFLNWGDRFELPVVVQNQTGAPLEVDVAARAVGVNVIETGRHVTVPAHDRVEVRLAAEAVKAGEARFQVAAASPSLSDAAEGRLPVYTPATAEAFATYGTFAGDSAVTLPLQVPGDAIPAFGGLEVTTTSTALQELTDALLYLVRYPYECAEQIASRMLGVTALRDVLYAFRTEELPEPDSLRASVDRDVRDLVARQNPDGGFGFWRRGEPSFPYVSIHGAHALQRAKEKGYEVPGEALQRSLDYLRRVPANVPAEYPADVRRALHAYALYVRARMGDARAAEDVRRFMAEVPRDSLTVEEAGWLLSAATGNAVLAPERAELLRFINNRATETASTATFATRYTEGEYLLLHSDRRTDGVVLEALVGAEPDNPLIPKTVRGLLGHRVRGRWDNTQENAWVLIALDRYFHAFEGQTPEFVARVWLGERFAGEHRFSGRQADRSLVSVPMRVLQEQHPGSVTIGKEGPGRLYYRAGLRYAPRDLDLLPLDAGFVVSRTYEAVDDPRDVTQGADGQWHVKAGARVRVTLTMTAPSRRLHVALVDPLPAGFEPVNPELEGSQDAPPAGVGGQPRPMPREFGWWWRMYWYQHQNLRDDRAEAFTSLLPAGTYTYSYVARATTPGRFIVPPPRAEEMYTPETFGRGKTERVEVIPADQR